MSKPSQEAGHGAAACDPRPAADILQPSRSFAMKTLLTCSAVVAALGFVARADDRTTVSTGPALMEGSSALVMPIDAAGMPGPAAPMMAPQLPHYYGNGGGAACGCCGAG